MINSFSKVKTSLMITTILVGLCCSFSSSIAATQGLNRDGVPTEIIVPPIELPNLDWVLKHANNQPAVKTLSHKSYLKAKPYGGRYTKQLIAKLSKEIQIDSSEYINHPRVGFLSSLTSDKQNANYLNELALHLQEIGAQNIPEGLLQEGSQKTVIVSMILDNQGRLLNSVISKSSRIKELDNAALKIIELAAPFKSLPESMSSRYDQVNITRTFVFNG